jgi:transcriptional regulator GlxA family with amidase domain
MVPGSYRIEVIGPTGDGQITMSNGVRLGVEPLPEPPPRHDTLLVAGGEGARRATDDPALVEWIACASRRARRTTSVCTGAYLLAAAGLLDGRRATTHWAFCDGLTERYPAVELDPDPVFIRDGDIWTSAGVTAGMDLALLWAGLADLVVLMTLEHVAMLLAMADVMFVLPGRSPSTTTAPTSSRRSPSS